VALSSLVGWFGGACYFLFRNYLLNTSSTLLRDNYTIGKDKFHPRTGNEGPKRQQRYSYTLSLTSVLDRVGGKRPGRFTLGKETRYPLYRRLSGLRAGLDRCGKSRPQPGFDPRTVQAVASRYTNWAVPTPTYHTVTRQIPANFHLFTECLIYDKRYLSLPANIPMCGVRDLMSTARCDDNRTDRKW
jgi:hypothetical protein